MADTDVGGDMTLKKKMTRTEFRKRADEILMRLTMEVNPSGRTATRSRPKGSSGPRPTPSISAAPICPTIFPICRRLSIMSWSSFWKPGWPKSQARCLCHRRKTPGRPGCHPGGGGARGGGGAPGVRQDHGVHLRLCPAPDLLQAAPLHHHRQRHRGPGQRPHRLPLPGDCCTTSGCTRISASWSRPTGRWTTSSPPMTSG